MDKKEHINEKITQQSINRIWRRFWVSEKKAQLKDLFGHRLFVEGYLVVKKYLPPGSKFILEVGGGSGRYGIKFAQNFPGSLIIIVDILEESLELVRRLSHELGLKNVKAKKEDVLRLSFPDNYFDIVFSDAVIQHLPDYKKAVREMTRVLKPDGVLIISVVNFWNFHTLYKFIISILGKEYEYGYEKSFTKRELKRVARDTGLKVIATDGFYVGYGISRLKKYHRIFHFLGRVINRISKILDKFTKRFVSRNFGFEIIIVGKK